MKVTDFNKGTILKLFLNTIYTLSLIKQEIHFILKRTISSLKVFIV